MWILHSTTSLTLLWKRLILDIPQFKWFWIINSKDVQKHLDRLLIRYVDQSPFSFILLAMCESSCSFFWDVSSWYTASVCIVQMANASIVLTLICCYWMWAVQLSCWATETVCQIVCYETRCMVWNETSCNSREGSAL